jgi:hypothetical protein
VPENLARAIDELSGEVRELKKEVQGERADRKAEQKRERWRLIIMFTTGLLVTILALGSLAVWNRHSIQVSNQKFCDYIQLQAAADAGTIDPPNTAGRKSADIAGKLYRDLGCN